ncbi:AfsA-related hotdog domain-containing protein [Aliikangiella sp. IMCC44359]|uniref:AfsA-related hotdog domain-containing protein n=1 Tax=Aliikangiella sp. IMCC44359 TaxID=3459125 RepID=UPI00403B0C65
MKLKNNPVLILVSDKFSEFAKNLGVMTYSDFIEGISIGTVEAEVVIVGQGFSSRAIELLQSAVNNSPLRDKISLILPDRDIVDSSLVHKKNKKNVVVSNLCRLSERQYKATLLLDESCDEMADHVTGQHVQGTLLIEAARQFMMAVLETEAFGSDERGEYSYVLNEINVSYSRYLFPINAEMICSIEELGFNNKSALVTSLSVEVCQNDDAVCVVSCKVTGYPKRKLAVIEAREAKKNLRNMVSRWNEQVKVEFAESPVFSVSSGSNKLESA